MSKIKIKNFGPINEGYVGHDGWIDIKKTTVFIGNQGSGKSTVAKVFSTLSWLEKAINRGDIIWGSISHNDFYNAFEYQRIKNYFKDDTIIEYEGDALTIKYNRNLEFPDIQKQSDKTFSVPKIMYIPAERNFLSVVKNAYGLKNLPDTLYTFAEELRKGQLELNGRSLQLPISEADYIFDKRDETSYIIGPGYELNLLESSSGFQSFVPLYLVTKFLSDNLQKEETVLREQLSVEQSVRRNKEIAEIMFNTNLSEQDKLAKVKIIDSKYLNTCLINIVEEPEQNLYPKSQWQLLKELIRFNNIFPENTLVITTHSPYLINYLTLSIKANSLNNSLKNDLLKNKLQSIVPSESMVDENEIIIYEFDEEKGAINKLDTEYGLPSDGNILNEKLGESNELFAQLLEIEQQL